MSISFHLQHTSGKARSFCRFFFPGETMRSALDHRPPVEGLRRLVLTGFMGSGKTTVGRLLAAKLGWRFADLDSAIEELLGRTVPQIFAEQGEAAFRAAELDALRELLAGSRIVIALGGGAAETPGLRELLGGSPETAVVYLRGAFQPLYARCVQQIGTPGAVDRPLLSSREEAERRFQHRQSLYEAMATNTVPADAGPPDEVVLGIMDALGPQLLLP
jgi:shikimate kinase